MLSYLPLSHVAAQMLDLVCPLVITAAGEGYGPRYRTRQPEPSLHAPPFMRLRPPCCGRLLMPRLRLLTPRIGLPVLLHTLCVYLLPGLLTPR